MPTAPTWEGRRQVTDSECCLCCGPLGTSTQSPSPGSGRLSLPLRMPLLLALWHRPERSDVAGSDETGPRPGGLPKAPVPAADLPAPLAVLGWGSRTSALRSCQVPTFRAVTASRGLPRPNAPCCDPRCGLRQPLQARVAWRNRGPSLRFPLLLVPLFLVNTVGSCFGVPSDCFNFDRRFPLPPCPCPFVVRGRWFPHLTCNWRSPRTTRFTLKCNSVVFSAAAALGNEHNVL